MAEPIRSLLMGPVYTLVSTAGVFYAMPPRTVRVWTSSSTVQLNTTASSTGAVAPTVSGGEFTSSAPFLLAGASVTVRLLPA